MSYHSPSSGPRSVCEMTVAVANFLTLPSDETQVPAATGEAVCRESPDVSLLVRQAQTGDAAAFGRLVAMHERAVLRAAMAALGSRADAEDAAQDAFVMAWRRLATFRGDAQFRTWLLTIGSNALKDAGRRAKRARLVPLDEGLHAAGGDPHELAVAAETERQLVDGLARLPRMQRDVFLLRAQQGMEYDEIAAALDTSVGAARVHYHHAVRRLKELLT